MKLDDRVWVDAWIKGQVIPNALQNAWIPDSPMLPLVARWLAEHNDALVYGQHTPGDWIDVIDAYADETDDLMDRMSLTVSVIPALRSLIAALTEGQG